MRLSNVGEIHRILNYIERNYQKDIRVSDISKALGYSTMHCSYLFKAGLGESIGSYLRSLRMEDAKIKLSEGFSVDATAKALSYSSRGFRKAFRECYGVSPLEYVRTGKTKEQFIKTYEWRYSEQNWGKGQNPTPDGLWEFAYYNPVTKEYGLMEWFERWRHFRAPFTVPDNRVDPNWYCRNRALGNGMHPGRVTHAVRTFLCPYSGTAEVFFSVGRLTAVKSCYTPCSVQLWHNDRPLEEPLVLKDLRPCHVTARVQVKKGDRIRLHLDPMGNHVADGVWLYRQKIAYTDVSEPYEKNRIPEGVRSYTDI